ncbi:MAG: M20 family metallo-hydrolase [Spirochaetia bacterium]|nr:M20 family metallo-hydrolase [Spirochaetia bacterium]
MKTAITKFIDSNLDTIIELETLLSSIPAISPLSGGEGEYRKAHALEKWLRDRGFENFEYINAPDAKASHGVRPSLILTIPGEKDDRTIWIISHVDVVPPGDLSLWHSDPYKVVVRDGRLYGRGVEDNQHGIVSSVMAALALKENDLIPEYTVKLMFIADEEIGSVYGLNYILREYPDMFRKEDLILIPDSGSSDGTEIEIAEKSMLWLKFTTRGVQCHASMPALGKNAMVAASRLILNLAELENEFKVYQDALFDPPYSTFAPTKKENNIPNVNTIPGEDIFYLDCRILPSVDIESVFQRINDICVHVEQKYGVSITITTVQKSVSKATDKDCQIVSRLKKAITAVTGKEVRLIGIGGGTVAAYLRNKGINAAVWSTIDETCHMPDENTTIESLAVDAKVMAHLMLE